MAELIPGEVNRQRGDGDRPEHEQDADATVAGQDSHREKSGHGGERIADLLRNCQGWHDYDAIMFEKLGAVSQLIASMRTSRCARLPRHKAGEQPD
jgi:hypothetical protein